jgi:hypothetical protein
MRISIASKEDSYLAITALYRLSNILIGSHDDFNNSYLHNHQLSLEDQSALTVDKIRIIEQLCECIELHMATISMEELTKSLWSIVTIDANEEYMQKILMEYQDRIKLFRNYLSQRGLSSTGGGTAGASPGKEEEGLILSYHDMALMVWTIGCVKDRYSTNSESLIEQLADCFILKSLSTISSTPFRSLKDIPISLMNPSSVTPTSRSTPHYFSFSSPFGTKARPSSDSTPSTSTPSTASTPQIASHIFHDEVVKSLNPKLLVRMLWSFALHKSVFFSTNNNTPISLLLPIVVGGLKTSIHSLSELSITNKVSLLWCCAQFSVIDDKSILLPLLKDLQQYILRKQPTHKTSLTLHEMKYITDALGMISHAARKHYVKNMEKNLVASESNNDGSTTSSTSTDSSSYEVTDSLEILYEINQIIKLLIQSALECPEFFDSPSLMGIIGLFEAVTNIELINYEETTELFLKKCLERFQKEIDRKISPRDASSILEAMVTIPDYPELLKSELEKSKLMDASFLSMDDPPKLSHSDGTSSSSSGSSTSHNNKKKPKLQIVEMIIFDPIWHELAGKLAVISSLGASEIGEKGKIIASAWSVACLGHSYRPLYRVARRATQFTVHELSAKHLARLAVSCAKVSRFICVFLRFLCFFFFFVDGGLVLTVGGCVFEPFLIHFLFIGRSFFSCNRWWNVS